MAIFTSSGNSKCAVDGHPYYPPKPAGDSHRHEDEETSALWDRLRADLEKLGTAYGVPFEPFRSTDNKDCGCVTLSCPHEPDPFKAGATQPIASAPATSQRRGLGAWIERATDLAVMAEYSKCLPADAGDPGSEIVTPEPELSEADLNLYYDGIILAARKKREAHSRRNDVEYWNALGARDAAANNTADTLSAAMSRPLSFPKRIGWKPGGGGE